ILLSKFSLITVLAFAICFGPTATWMLAHKSSVMARASKFEIGASGNLLFDRLMGVESLIEAAFLFSILAIAIAGIIALIHRRKRTAPATPLTTGEKFLRLLILVGLVIVLVGVVATGANNVKDRWLQPVLFLTPALMASLLGRYRIGDRPLIDYAIVSAVAALIVPPVLSYNLTYGSGSPPYGQLDYRHLYEEVQAKGPFKTILTDNAQIPGNFRLFDSTLRVVHPETPDTRAHLTPPVIVMWFGGAEPNERIAALLRNANIAMPHESIVTTDVVYKTRPDKHMTVSYFLVP
ncbi:MAG TPA: glycosyl transferase, partial [Ochrobactrum intermedium]|nr:glycosyl transferase [Brucella intermedia]